jgi:hypothetical protein
MISGSILEMVGMQRSVGGFHGIRPSSGVFLWPFGCSLWLLGLPGDEVDDTQVGSCRGCFVGSFLGGEVYPCGGEVDGLAYPLHRPMDHSYQPRGQGLHVRCHPVLSLLIGTGTCQEEKTSRGIVI